MAEVNVFKSVRSEKMAQYTRALKNNGCFYFINLEGAMTFRGDIDAYEFFKRIKKTREACKRFSSLRVRE